MWSGKVVKGVEEGNSPSHLAPVFAEAQAFAGKRSQCLTHREIDSLNQAGTDAKTKLLKSLSAT